MVSSSGLCSGDPDCSGTRLTPYGRDLQRHAGRRSEDLPTCGAHRRFTAFSAPLFFATAGEWPPILDDVHAELDGQDHEWRHVQTLRRRSGPDQPGEERPHAAAAVRSSFKCTRPIAADVTVHVDSECPAAIASDSSTVDKRCGVWLQGWRRLRPNRRSLRRLARLGCATVGIGIDIAFRRAYYDNRPTLRSVGTAVLRCRALCEPLRPGPSRFRLDQLVRALYPDGLGLDLYRIRPGEVDDIALSGERDDRIFSRGQSRRE